MAENRAIGHRSKIPWHLPEDFKWFKRMTTGNIVVMGRKTFDSIGKPLPNRTIIVLSRKALAIPGVRIVPSLEAIDPNLELADVFICGGAEVYAQALPRCSDLFLTRVKRSVIGDTFFPPFEHLFELREKVLDHPEFVIEHYRNKHLEG